MQLPSEARRLIAAAQSKTRKMPALALSHALALDRELQRLGVNEPVTYSANGVAFGAEDMSGSATLGTPPESRATLWRAEHLRRQNQVRQAATVGFQEAVGAEILALSLLYVNLSLGNERVWLHLINKYLAHRTMMAGQPKDKYKLQLASGDTGRFFRISLAAHEKLPPINDGPRVTVLMPVYNAEKTLEFAANSILDQTWRHLELWLIDDSSTDKSRQIAHRLKQKDPRVRVLELPQNGGPYIAKNIGVQRSSGRYITVHDADDWAFPTRLADQIAAIEQNADTQVVMANMLRIQEDGLIRRIQPTGWITSDGGLRICFPSMLFERSYFTEKLGAWDSVKAGADFELYHRIKRFDPQSLATTDTPAMLQLDSVGSLTSSDELFNDERGVSQWRTSYQNAWLSWHLKHRKLPKLKHAESIPLDCNDEMDTSILGRGDYQNQSGNDSHISSGLTQENAVPPQQKDHAIFDRSEKLTRP